MKKTFLLGIILVLALAGCSSAPKESEESKVLKVAGLNSGYGTKGWEEVAKAFEEYKGDGTKVELTLEKNISDVLRPQIQAGDVPDVIYLSMGAEGGLTDSMVSEKQLVEITDIYSMEVPGESVKVGDKVNEGVKVVNATAPYGDDKVYLAPVFYAPTGLFYNAGLFEAEGWTVPTTWDEMFALGEAAKAKDIALFTYPTTGYFDAFFSSLLNNVVGPEQYDKLMNYDLAAWEDAKTKEAFEIVGRLLEYAHPDTVSQANGEGFQKNQQLILDNKALFVPNGTWLPGEMSEAPRAENFKWGFTTLPTINTGDQVYTTTFIEEVYIPQGAENVELAKEFIAFLYSDKAAEIFATNGGAIQPVAGASKFITDADTKMYYAVYDNGVIANPVGFVAKDPVEGVDLTSGEGILYGTINEVASGQKTAEQWYEQVLEAVKKYQ